MHYNESSEREQVTTADGVQRFSVLFPKYKRGGHIVRRLMTDPTFSKLTLWEYIHNSYYLLSYTYFIILLLDLYLIQYLFFSVDYVDDLMTVTISHCMHQNTLPSTSTVFSSVPVSLSSSFQHPDKSSAIVAHVTRFSKP